MHKKMFGYSTLLFSAILFSGCATKSDQSNHSHASASRPLVASPAAIAYPSSTVAVYKESSPPAQDFDDITMIQIDVYNEYGIKRQQAQMNKMLEEQACYFGGNAVILMQNDDKKHCYAEVIRIKPGSDSRPNNTESSSSISAIKQELVTK